MRRFIIILISVLIVIALIGIGIWYSRGGKKQKPLIGVSLLTKQHVFYRDLEQGMREEAAKRNVDLVIESAEFDNASKQLKLRTSSQWVWMR
jgi:ribose transport system substrate-binding protein